MRTASLRIVYAAVGVWAGKGVVAAIFDGTWPVYLALTLLIFALSYGLYSWTYHR